MFWFNNIIGSGQFVELYKVRSLSNILLDIKDIQDLKKMYILAEGVERGVVEKLVQEALAT